MVGWDVTLNLVHGIPFSRCCLLRGFCPGIKATRGYDFQNNLSNIGWLSEAESKERSDCSLIGTGTVC